MTEDTQSQSSGGPSPGSLASNPHENTGSSGAWVFWMVGALLLGMTAWAVWMVIESTPTMPGDRPEDPTAVWTHGFELDNCTIPRNGIKGGGPTKDGIPALTDPPHVAGKDVKRINEEMHGKFLVSGERVVGVTVNDESRAYPLTILTWHEVVNDTLGGTPIAVTYCPLCDSAIVFERTVGDEVLEFGVSGLLYNNNVLLYDRRGKHEKTKESLWSQLQMKAVCGPAADEGRTLTVVPSRMAHWAEWFEDNPDTTAIEFPIKYNRKYNENPYKTYFHTGELMFEVEPAPTIDLPPMTRLVAVKRDGEWQTYYYDLHGEKQPRMAAKWVQDGLEFNYQPVTIGMDPPVLSVTAEDGSAVQTVYSFWEPWYAMHPGGPEPVRLPVLE